MDAIALLKNDHQTVSKLFKQFENLGEHATTSKQGLVTKITEELTTHAYIEETIFYPFARERVPDVEDDVKEGIEEHHVLKVTMAELAAMSPDDEEYDAKVTVLKEVVEHHVEEEEDDWFPKVRDAVGRNDLGEVGDQMEVAKSDAPDRPDPSE
ncbi:MAG: hemerythrin domain-containing protein [Actinobacteria bacterium]|nr:hemerythrin domain-containing protein [Actinomycetota bacterium]